MFDLTWCLIAIYIGIQFTFFTEAVYKSRLKSLIWQERLFRKVPLVRGLSKSNLKEFNEGRDYWFFYFRIFGVFFLGIAIIKLLSFF